MFSQTISNDKRIDDDKRTRILLIGVIIANLCISIPLAFWLNIWSDEAYSLMTTGKDLQHTLHQSLYFEKNFPVYYVLLYLWRQLNSSIFFARLFSILCISLTIYIAVPLSKRFLPNVHPVLLSALIAFHPFTIWAAVEIRLYALSILLSALLVLLFHDTYLDIAPQKHSKWWFTVVAVLAIYTFIPTIFLLAGFGIVLLVFHKHRFRDYFLQILFVGLFSLPLTVFIYQRMTTLDYGASCPTPPGSDAFSPHIGIQTVGRTILYFFLPLTGTYYQNLPIFWRLIVVILAVLLIMIGVISFRASNKLQRTTWLLFIGSSLILSLGMAVAKIHAMKYATIIFPLCLISILITLNLGYKKYTKIVILYIAAIFISYSLMLFNAYAAMAKPGDLNRVISYINSSENISKPILVFPPGIATTFSFLYKGSSPVVVLPESERYDGQDNWCRYFLKNETEIEKALSTLPQSPSAYPFVWLVTEHPGTGAIPEYRKSFQILDDFLKQDYEIESSQDFHGSTVRLLRRK